MPISPPQWECTGFAVARHSLVLSSTVESPLLTGLAQIWQGLTGLKLLLENSWPVRFGIVEVICLVSKALIYIKP